MKRSRFYTFTFLTLGFFIGELIAAALIKVDLNELRMVTTFDNILWIVNGQALHWVSIILFPLIFGFIGFLISFIVNSNLMIRKRERLARSGNIILSMVARDVEIERILNIICSSLEREMSDFKAMFFMNHEDAPQIISATVQVPSNARIIRDCQKLLLRACRDAEMIRGELSESKLSASLIKELQKNALNNFCYYPVIDACGRALGILVLFSNGRLPLDFEAIGYYSRMAETALNKYWYRQELKWARALSDNTSRLAALGDMYRRIAHEVNNPLAIISLINQAVRKGMKEGVKIRRDRILKYCDTMDGTLQRLQTIIKGLERISDSSEDIIDEINLSEIIEESSVLFDEKFKSSGIRMEVEFRDIKGGCSIECRANEIIQVLVSLLNNSCEAIEYYDDPWIKIIVSGTASEVCFSVEDCGPGILKENKNIIFNPFFTTKDKGEGTGLGLAISKRIIEEHSGQIYADDGHSNTRIEFVIPRRRRLVRPLTFRSKLPQAKHNKEIKKRLYKKQKRV